MHDHIYVLRICVLRTCGRTFGALKEYFAVWAAYFGSS